MRFVHMRADAAKLIIIVLVFPIFAWMFDLSSLWNFVQGIPIFDIWLEMLRTVNEVDPADLLVLAFGAFFETALMGFFVGMFRKIAKLINARGNLPILSTFGGLFLSCIILRVIAFTGDTALLLELVLLIVGIILMFKATFRSHRLFSSLDILALFADCLLATAAVGLVVAFTMFSSRTLSLGKLLSIMGIMIVMLFIDYFVSKIAEKE